ncbi:MAG: phosphatidate cytidylyltransferase [Pseudomonadota bacterium]
MRRAIVVRLVSSAILIPLVLAAVYLGGRVFAGLVAFLCVVMIFEWTRMVEHRAFSPSFYVLALGATGSLLIAPSGAYGTGLLICALSGAAALWFSRNQGGPGLWAAAAAPYIIAPSIALMWLRFEPEAGRALTFFLYFVVWAADTGAFVTGKALGGPKISHALSPNKTWAGIAGGVIGGGLIGLVSGGVFFGFVQWPLFLALGGALGAVSVVGDLVESGFKRRFGLKDISGFIPGHGGALDRLDGMIFATAAMTSAVYIYMLLG